MTPILTQKGIEISQDHHEVLGALVRGILPAIIIDLLYQGIIYGSISIIGLGIGIYWILYMPFCLGSAAHLIYDLIAIVLPMSLIGLGVQGGQEIIIWTGLGGLFVLIISQAHR